MSALHRKLIGEARKALRKAYCPYSRFRVGAAVLTSRGRIYTGTNVENASYGLSVCAERVAVFKAVSAGERYIKAIAVALDSGQCASPCGACRQVIFEFGREAEVITAAAGVRYTVHRIVELLPEPFGPETLAAHMPPRAAGGRKRR